MFTFAFIFMKISFLGICIKAQDRLHMQTCLDCSAGESCVLLQQNQFNTWQACLSSYSGNTGVLLVDYNSAVFVCKRWNCTAVKQNMGSVSFRWSFSSECTQYEIFTVNGHVGTCDVIDFYSGDVTQEYCLDRCLDMDNCRAVSFNAFNMTCLLHSCTDKIQDGNSVFIKRMCVNSSAAEKNYIQTCNDCSNFCWDPVYISRLYTGPITSNCNGTCSDCDNVVYDRSTEECTQRQCDRPVSFGSGKKLTRKVTYQDCPEFNLRVAFHSPACEAFAVDEGYSNNTNFLQYLADGSWCYRRCLDTPECLSIAFLNNKSCSYHNCIDQAPLAAGVGSMVYRDCVNNCSSPFYQTCVNCMPGPNCQSSYYTVSGHPESSCLQKCQMEGHCGGLHIEEQLCSFFDCTQPTMSNNSTLYRKTCSGNVCSVYEVYMVTGLKGTDETIIPSMTELQTNKHVCYERCLETSICRAVSFRQNSCYYHTSDCMTEDAEGWTFTWRYCLSDVSERTNLTALVANAMSTNQTNGVNVQDLYPRAGVNCDMTTSTTSTSTITVTSPSTSTTTITVTNASTITSNSPAALTNSTVNTSNSSVASTISPTNSILNLTGSASISTENTSSAQPNTTPITTTSTSNSSVNQTGITTTPTPNNTISSSTMSSQAVPMLTLSTGIATYRPIYIMPCLCSTGAFANLTVQEIVQQLEKNLTVAKRNLSSYRRKNECAKDNRSSSKTMGGVGVGILASLLAGIVVMDWVNIVSAMKGMLKRMRKCFCKKKKGTFKVSSQ